MLLTTKNKCRQVNFLAIMMGAAFCLLLLPSCFTRIPGCLDLAATNYDLDADRACDDCCTYPTLQLTLTQHWNGENFNSDNVYHDALLQPFRITDLKYMLSHWIIKENGQRLRIDSASFLCNNVSMEYYPDIILVDSRQFQYDLGTFRHAPKVDSILFAIGVPSELSCIDESAENILPSLQESNPLYSSTTDMFHTLRIIYQPDTGIIDMDTLLIDGLYPVQIPFDTIYLPGQDQDMGVTVDYGQWFNQADIRDSISVRNSIIAQWHNSFTQTP